MRMSLARLTIAAATVLASTSEHEAWGQCMQWDVSPGLNATSAYGVQDLRVLDIGSGPQLFAAVDDSVRRWTGASWVAAGGGGFDDIVLCVGTYDSGSGPELYAGGMFTHVNYPPQYPAYYIAKRVNGNWGWAGSYIPITGGGHVSALTAFDDGQGPKLFVGGAFATYLPVTSRSILTWNGTTWAGVGGGLAGPSPGPQVKAMCVFDDGTGPALYVAGWFLTAGGVLVNNIAKWNGTNWGSLGSGLTFPSSGNPGAYALSVFDDGTGPALYVCGHFDHAGGVPADSVAKWDGTSWAAVPGLTEGPFPDIYTISLATLDDGSGPALYVGFNQVGFIGQSEVRGVARWDGQAWSSLGGGFSGQVWALESFDDGQGGGPALWVGGSNTGDVGGSSSGLEIARWYGSCTNAIDPMCFGDGTFAPCPCAHNGTSLHGCSSAAAASGALLSATGTTTPDTLVLQSSPEAVTSRSMFLQSSSLLPIQESFGHGILCLGGELQRLYVKASIGGTAQAPGPGDPSITQMSASLGDPIAPGSVRYYQVWYHDESPGFCNLPGYNLSNGLRVVW